MNKDFIKNIYNNNSSPEGLESLFNSLSSIEEFHWNGHISHKVTNWTQVFSDIANDNISKKVIIEVDTDTSYTYGQLESASEKIKNFINANIDEYQIGLNLHNSFLFLASLIGINKANRLAILFNNREPEARQIEHAVSSKTKVVFGNKIEGLEYFDIEDILNNQQKQTSKVTCENIPTNNLDNPAFVIFTSGTTGKSKGALFSHRRMLGAGIAWSLRTGMTCCDNCYIPLPLYHGNALAVAFSSVIYARACATVRVKFSVSEFFHDINKYECSHMVYIGELWRYILNKTKTNENKSLKVIFGNGLTKPLWDEVVKRFDIKHVVEHFGATEMPAGALTNWYNVSGYCGYLPPNDPRLAEMVLADEEYKPVGYGKNGEALFLVPSGKYRGYLDNSLDEAKLQRDLFKKGDLWWKSGDLLQSHENGFFTFIERLGDTYRYKGENVACVDVEEVIRESYKFNEVIVYGISLPKVDGKIGMASLVITNSFHPKEILEYLQNNLPNYALPYFIRIQKEKHQTTSTLKIQKTKIAKESIQNYKELEHFVLVNGSYQKVNEELYNAIMNGELNL
jgi:fatty-acyl-CoA synthase